MASGANYVELTAARPIVSVTNNVADSGGCSPFSHLSHPNPNSNPN